jgi:hypothetical protein
VPQARAGGPRGEAESRRTTAWAAETGRDAANARPANAGVRIEGTATSVGAGVVNAAHSGQSWQFRPGRVGAVGTSPLAPSPWQMMPDCASGCARAPPAGCIVAPTASWQASASSMTSKPSPGRHRTQLAPEGNRVRRVRRPDGAGGSARNLPSLALLVAQPHLVADFARDQAVADVEIVQ